MQRAAKSLAVHRLEESEPASNAPSSLRSARIYSSSKRQKNDTKPDASISSSSRVASRAKSNAGDIPEDIPESIMDSISVPSRSAPLSRSSSAASLNSAIEQTKRLDAGSRKRARTHAAAAVERREPRRNIGKAERVGRRTGERRSVGERPLKQEAGASARPKPDAARPSGEDQNMDSVSSFRGSIGRSGASSPRAPVIAARGAGVASIASGHSEFDDYSDAESAASVVNNEILSFEAVEEDKVDEVIDYASDEDASDSAPTAPKVVEEDAADDLSSFHCGTS
ncbi:hypothetical protein BDK51DRAFT_48946, partial [Blyttiomyces helicus]